MSEEKIAGIAAIAVIAEIGLRRCFRGYASRVRLDSVARQLSVAG